MKTQVIEVQTDHELEDLFDIEPSTTIVDRVEPIPMELVPAEEYDEKDNEIEKQFQEVYEAAFTAFEAATLSVEQIEPKFRARNEEVAAVYLTTALAAAREKALVKAHKDKVALAKTKGSAPKTVNNNLIIDRNELLKHMLGKKEDSK